MDAKLLQWLPAGILLYCVSQPLLDVVGYWQDYYQISNTVTMAVRLLLLAGSVGLGFLLSDRKKYYWLVFAILAVLTGLHAVANLPGGYREPMQDLVNLLRIYLLPLTVLCFITFLRRGGERVFRALKTGLLVNFLLIAAVELLSVVTGTDRNTYAEAGIGVFGWFLWGNCQSAILSMLAPIVMCWSLNRWREQLLPVVLLTAAAEALLFFFGTRLTFAAMLASGLGVCVCLLLAERTRWRQAVAILLVTALFTCAFPVSPTARRMKLVAEQNAAKQQTVDEKEFSAAKPETTHPERPAPGTAASEQSEAETGEAAPAGEPQFTDEEWKKLEWVYQNYFAGVVKRFGLRRVMEKYNYTTDTSILGDTRTHKLYFCEMAMEDAPVLCRFFGLNLAELRVFMPSGFYNERTGVWEDGYANYDVENDFHGVYFLLGWVGLGLMLGMLLWFGLRALYRVLRDFRTYFTMELAGFAGAYCFALVHAYFTVSVLRRNNASVYLAFVLAALWYLTVKKPASGGEGAAHEAT